MGLVKTLVNLRKRNKRRKERKQVRPASKRVIVDGKYEDLIGDLGTPNHRGLSMLRTLCLERDLYHMISI